MNKKINSMKNEKLTGDAVIKRGYAIYDEWLEKKPSSRKIVESVENAVCAIAKNKTKMASVEALSYLFALDMRIRERYKSILHCIFRYFSWRREIGALKRLKDILNIPVGGDIRDAIEVALQAIRESIDAEDIEDSDDETHGGKLNGKSEETVSENKQQEQTAEELSNNSQTEELENSEEKEEEISSETIDEENIEESLEEQALNAQDEQQNALEEMPEQSVELINAEENQIEINEINIDNLNIENNSSLDNTSKPLDNNNYIDAIDAAGFFSFGFEEKSETKETIGISDQPFVESGEKGGEEPVDLQPTDGENKVQENDASRDEQIDDLNNDAYLHDVMLNADKGEELSNVEAVKENLTAEAENQNPYVDAQNVTPIAEANNKNDMRVPIQIDINNDLENEYRKEIDRAMTAEMVEAMVKRMAEEGREQMKIAFADLGMEDPIEMVGFDDLNEVKETTSVVDRK